MCSSDLDPGNFYQFYAAAEGRSGGANYHASWSNLKEEGVLMGKEGFVRNNFRVNVDQRLGSETNGVDLIPVLHDLQRAGKIRHLGVTELFEQDTSHSMLQRALIDDVFDVVMVGFNLLNPSARRLVFPQTRARNVGVLVMFAVRAALSRPERLAGILAELLERGEIPEGATLDFLGDAAAITEAGYRFCRHEPGVDVVLGGTSRIDHLLANLAAMERGPLSASALAELERLFGNVESVSGS